MLQLNEQRQERKYLIAWLAAHFRISPQIAAIIADLHFSGGRA